MKFIYQDSAPKRKATLPESAWPPPDCRLPDDETLAILSGDGDADHDLFAFFDQSLREEAEDKQRQKRARLMGKLRQQIDMATDPLKRPRLPRPGDYWAPPALDRIYT